MNNSHKHKYIYSGRERTISTRNSTIDLLRIIFALLVVTVHCRGLLGEYSWVFDGGWIGVEFFFIVSGYLMVASATKSEVRSLSKNNKEELGTETVQFLWRKLKKLLPYIIISFIVACAVICIVRNYNPLNALTLIVYALPQLMLIFESGIYFRASMPNVVLWYLSAMFIAMLILYPILRKNINTFTHIIAPIIFLLSIGYISCTYGHLDVWGQWTGFTTTGIIRALGEISLGCCCYAICQKISALRFGILGRVILTLIASCGFIVVILKACGNIDTFSIIALLILAVSITITFSNKGIITPALNRINLTKIADVSMVLFLCHCSILPLFTSGLICSTLSPIMKFTIFILSAILVSILVYCVVEIMKGIWTNIPKKYKDWIVCNGDK